MTRLTATDIGTIKDGLTGYDRELIRITGRGLLGVACHACGADEASVRKQLDGFAVGVVPITSGQGVISGFSRTVAAILEFLGCAAQETRTADVAGICEVFQSGFQGLMMADDHTFCAINLTTRRTADNSEMTGRVFAAALDLMAGGITGSEGLVLGCGPVGRAAAGFILEAGGRVVLHDIDAEAAGRLQAFLTRSYAQGRVRVEAELARGMEECRYVLEATPAGSVIPDGLLTDRHHLAAPGVPLGVSPEAAAGLGRRLVHDRLELGVAAMAAAMAL